MSVLVTLLLTMIVGLAIGWTLLRIAERRLQLGLPPYDQPGFPAPALWGLIGWLATPLALPVFCWRFGLKRWLLPSLAGWWLLLYLVATVAG